LRHSKDYYDLKIDYIHDDDHECIFYAVLSW